MPVSTTYDKEKDILYVRVQSPVTVDDFRGVINKIITSEEHASHVNTLWDFRKLNFVELDPTALEEIIEIKKGTPQRKNTKRALVISNELGFGMTKMYESMASDLPDDIMIFRHFENAEIWLMSGA